MSLVGYLILLTAALCWTVHGAPAPGSCIKPERKQEAELQGVWEDDTYPENTQAIFNCRPGYSRLGSMKYICLRGKWETVGTLGKCRKKSCGDPGDVAFGSFELKLETEFVFGARVVYHCDEGYQMVSRQNTRDCTASGWSNFPPHCEVRRCPPLDVDVGVTVISSSYDDEEFSVGKVIRFECKNPKFGLEGPAEVFCKSEGQWNSPPPICQVISCSTPQISNGNVRIKKETYMENEIMTYACNAKYKPDTRTGVTCTRSGWSPSPSCVEIACYAESVANGEVVKDKDVYREGDIIELKCNRGFKIEYEPDAPRKCTAMGWSPSLKCISLACDRPVIENGRLYYHYYDYQFPQRINRELDYFCKDGFLPPEKSYYGRITCTEDGWSPEPKCLKTCSNNDIRVENADLRRTLNMYVSGEKVQYSCNPGLTTPDGKEGGEIECLPNGKFSPGKCLRECKMSNLDHGSYQTDKNIFEVGEYLRYTCDKGFRSPRNRTTDSAQCLQQGWSVPPQCVEITCSIESTEKKVYKDGDTVRINCQAGYTLRGSKVSQCYYYGWDPPLPTCEETRCTIPRNSNFKPHPNKSSYQVNEEVRFFCDGNFKLTGLDRSRCSADGWHPQLPTCEEIRCTIPSTNTVIGNSKDQSYRIGTEVTFSCPRGSTLKGNTKSRCSKSGWSSPLPTCQEEKPDQPDPTTDERDKDSPGKPEQPPTDKSDTSTGEQSPDKPERRPQCPPPPRPINTQESIPKNGYYNGDTVEIKCKAGYKLHGSGTVLCDNGKWESSPQCVELKKCGNPPSIDNGEMIKESTQEEYYSDSVVRYRCKTGLHITGSNESYCYNGRWSSPPICTGDPCGKAPPVEFGHIPRERQNYVDGESVQYTCLEGYKLVGETSAKCLEGKWWQLPSCIYTACEPPPKIPHGRLKANLKISYRSGDKVSYECDSGYALEKKMTNEAVCADTQWKQIPVCRRLGEVCNPPPTVENGDITDSRQPSYRSGSVVEYKCPSYYKLKGNQKVKCENGVWDDPPICLEPCTAGERVMRANNIQLRWTDIKKLYSEHDDEMEFGCLNGYEPSPSAVFRVKCNRGELLYPKCIKRGSCLLSQETMERNSIFINRSTEIEQGETIEFKCNEGMVPENTLTATCQKKTIIYPKCTTRKKCKSAPVVANGKLKTEAQRSYDSGASVEFECREDTVLAGSINVKCDNGQWSEPPQCLESCKISKEELGRKNVELQLSEDMSKTHKHGSEVNFKCKSGSNRPYRPASLKGECSNGKMIYPRCFTGQTCRLYQEKVDENFLELDPIHDNEGYYGDGEIVQFICKQGFYSHSALKGNCTKGELTYPECKRKNACYINQEILDKHNLELSTSQQHRKYFASSTEITFTCKPGYAKNNKTITKKCIKGVIMYPEIHCRLGTSV
ncbi:complement factor H-like isoform X14 [Ascaphus truei]|uniref:complement factor H-like isoform X14 n=1 Tax=Ascaphus truei TaxID=8439 RepID=UPI003F594AD7